MLYLQMEEKINNGFQLSTKICEAVPNSQHLEVIYAYEVNYGGLTNFKYEDKTNSDMAIEILCNW